LELSGEVGQVVGRAPVGRVFVDGKGIGNVGESVLRDRQHLAQDGVVVVVIGVDRHRGKLVAGPEILSRGFVYEQASETLMDEMKALIVSVVERSSEEEWADRPLIQQRIKSALKKHLQREFERRPVIVPVIIEV
jgi:ribonuclease J